MIDEQFKDCFEKKHKTRDKPDSDNTKLIKDQECATCNNWTDCKGKQRGTLCINYQKRLPNNERSNYPWLNNYTT